MIDFEVTFNFDKPFISGHKFDKKLWKHIYNQIYDLTRVSNTMIPVLEPGYFPVKVEEISGFCISKVIGYIEDVKIEYNSMTINGTFLDNDICHSMLDQAINDGKLLMLSPYGFGTRRVDPLKGPDYILKGFNTSIVEEDKGTGMVKFLEEEK